MDKQLFSISDISDDLVQYTDMYMKRVIINAKRHYYREKSKMQKHGIVFVDLETFAETLGYKDARFEKVLCQYIEVKGIRISVHHPDPAMALLALTETQRSVLIQNVVFNITLKQIACDLKISERMVRKHKHNAIESVRRRLKQEYEAKKQ